MVEETMTRLIGLACVLSAIITFAPAAWSQTSAVPAVAQAWIDGWNSKDPDKLMSAFTIDGVYEDVPFGIKKKGSAELREMHKFFHDAVSDLYCKFVDAHVADGNGTIEWIFGGKDIGVFKTGKPFAVPGVSVIEVKDGKISRNLDYYDAATIMKQVGVLPERKAP
jgi:steroid delta-isomerase-like uncharacterized protein